MIASRAQCASHQGTKCRLPARYSPRHPRRRCHRPCHRTSCVSDRVTVAYAAFAETGTLECMHYRTSVQGWFRYTGVAISSIICIFKGDGSMYRTLRCAARSIDRSELDVSIIHHMLHRRQNKTPYFCGHFFQWSFALAAWSRRIDQEGRPSRSETAFVSYTLLHILSSLVVHTSGPFLPFFGPRRALSSPSPSAAVVESIPHCKLHVLSCWIRQSVVIIGHRCSSPIIVLGYADSRRICHLVRTPSETLVTA